MPIYVELFGIIQISYRSIFVPLLDPADLPALESVRKSSDFDSYFSTLFFVKVPILIRKSSEFVDCQKCLKYMILLNNFNLESRLKVFKGLLY
jgi:hypothetical protein